MADCDLMVCVQTGSGKTAEFMLPILHKLLEERRQHSARSHLRTYLLVCRRRSRRSWRRLEFFSCPDTLAISDRLHGAHAPYQRGVQEVAGGHINEAMPRDEHKTLSLNKGGRMWHSGQTKSRLANSKIPKQLVHLLPLQALLEAIKDTCPRATVMLCVAHKYNNFSEQARRVHLGAFFSPIEHRASISSNRPSSRPSFPASPIDCQTSAWTEWTPWRVALDGSR